MSNPTAPDGYIESRIHFDPDSECWLWTGSKFPTGYGVVQFGPRAHRFTQSAHRYVYQLHKGSIPDGLVLDHLCRVRECVNPDHLEPVTNRENILRGIGPSAQLAAKTHCKNGHEFTPSNTYVPPDGSARRVCRTCRRAKAKDAWAEVRRLREQEAARG